jgi:hypothetical protein
MHRFDHSNLPVVAGVARLPCHSHVAVFADRSGVPDACLVLLLSDSISLNIRPVNDGNRLKLLLQRNDFLHPPSEAARQGEIEFV